MSSGVTVGSAPPPISGSSVGTEKPVPATVPWLAIAAAQMASGLSTSTSKVIVIVAPGGTLTGLSDTVSPEARSGSGCGGHRAEEKEGRWKLPQGPMPGYELLHHFTPCAQESSPPRQSERPASRYPKR